MPEKGFVVEQGNLGGWRLVVIMSTRELPICGATSCSVKDVDKLVINVMIKALSAEEMTKGEDI